MLTMKYTHLQISDLYQINFVCNRKSFNIYVKRKTATNKITNFKTVKVNFKNIFNDYISNFGDLINQIANQTIIINLYDNFS